MTPLPPLVEPGDELTAAEIARYSRHLIMPDVGTLGQRRLKNARVLVMGGGGLGSPTLLYLAAAGVGTLGIVDFDVVDESNLQRQIIHGVADVGRLKTDSAADAIAAVNPSVRVQRHDVQLTSENAVDLFSGYDLIVDGTDNFATRYLVNDAAALAGKPYVWGSIFRFDGQVSVFWEAAPDDRGLNYRDLYPQPPPAGLVPSCAEGGVLGLLCGTIGSLMGTEAVKLICGIGDTLLGRLLIYDALRMTMRTVRFGRDPQRRPITGLIDYEAFCGIGNDDEPVIDAADALSPQQLAEELAGPAPPVLIDVREAVEFEIVALPGARLIPSGDITSGARLGEIPHQERVVLYCKTGIRSAQALAALRRAGLGQVVHLAGGIAAWGRDVDPDLPMY
ncbi:putative molybdopterin synthase sulfurylase MoeB [Gordonia hirsuta DSM 44140 = NBRC 16056]|uniref:Putative molybdopterin synthase sulfurylase MoeB n=1 Tax=Gordonia hirsuta DSM 44140 = NBRC 16056 TaxID=1121927 RepID=L7L609_9ACTN|nr:molybdopterin-synthase adenylyltransferase MoeB [Gordonia hirsuta]GAC56384.1 putative molybdopterin synthase sulfurylase MoeB [Gordonia hirsuta DSM 44140 = NBRC 16056]